MQFRLIPVNSGWGAQIRGTGLGGTALKGSGLRHLVAEQLQAKLFWQEPITPKEQEKEPHEVPPAETIPHVTEVIEKLAKELQSIPQKDFPIILGGDHSIAMGTWSALVDRYNAYQQFGLIWVDAHMDSHTFETSESKAPHGMPVAALLGYGHQNFTSVVSDLPKINPKHLCLVGIRSFEAGEQQLLERLGVKVYYIDEVLARGFSSVMEEAKAYVKTQTKAFGLSIDLDGFDPKDVPAVGSREKNGIPILGACDVVSHIVDDPACVAVEIAEFNPKRDIEHKTATFLAELILAVIKGKENE